MRYGCPEELRSFLERVEYGAYGQQRAKGCYSAIPDTGAPLAAHSMDESVIVKEIVEAVA